MLSRPLVRPAGVIVGAGTALTAFGVAAPAQAVVDCSLGVTVDAIEQEIRDAITDGETLICINAGTVDMSSSGTDATDNAFEVNGNDLTLVGLGEVIFDGGDEAPNAVFVYGGGNEDLTVDGITFQNFNNGLENPYGVVTLEDSLGTLTVINSTFFSNSGYSMVAAMDFEGERYSTLVVDDSVFDSNEVFESQVIGYADVTVTDSTFVDNDGAAIESDGDAVGESLTLIHGNHFTNNTDGEAQVSVASTHSIIYNNTFSGNVLTQADLASSVNVWGENSATVAFNTFIDNHSTEGLEPNVSGLEGATVHVMGNIFVPGLEMSYAVDEFVGAEVVDAGGNFSVTDDSDLLDHESSHNVVDVDSLVISEVADNGGPTWTAAIGAESVAVDAIVPGDAVTALGFDLDVDQRGEERTGNLDAGAFEVGAELADTGVDVRGIALIGGLASAAGIVLAGRSRRRV